MTISWLSYKRSAQLLDSSLVANDAYIGLDFLNSTGLELTAEQRSTYRQNVKKGLELVDQLNYQVTRAKDQVEKKELYPLVQQISKDLRLGSQDLQEIFNKAKQEINSVLQSKTTTLEHSLKLFSSISRTTSAKLNSQYRYIR